MELSAHKLRSEVSYAATNTYLLPLELEEGFRTNQAGFVDTAILDT